MNNFFILNKKVPILIEIIKLFFTPLPFFACMHKLKEYTDESLLDCVKQGDEDAFTELYNRYWERLVTIAYFKLQHKEDAKEVVQELFMDIWNRKDRLDIKHSFYTYMAGALKYKIYTKLAKDQKRQRQLQALQKETVSHITEEWLSFEQLRNDLEKAVLNLPEKCKLVFRLSREEGLSGRQIAKELNLSPKTVENHIARALQQLRATLRILMSILP